MRLLDLYCGGGLAGFGYWMSGRFNEIVGIDINDMAAPYPFDFIRKDALTLDYDFLSQFDMIHASPPCQAYSNLTPNDGICRPKLIAATELMLVASGIPYVIENVQGASLELKPNMVMNGLYFNLPLNRKRIFKISQILGFHQFIKSGAAINVHGSKYVQRRVLINCFGLNANNISTRWVSNLSSEHIEQGIPPIFTDFIAKSLVAAKSFI